MPDPAPDRLRPEVRAARKLRDALAALADPAAARRARAFFKPHDRVRLLGVPAPALRRLAADLWRREAREWSYEQAIAFADLLVTRPELEAKAVGLLLFGRCQSRLDPRALRVARDWLRAGRIADWATTDTLCAVVLRPLLDRRRELRPRVVSWSRSTNPWVRRAAAVSLTSLAARGEALGEAYAVARLLARDRHPLVEQAAGWLLREAGKADPDRLERFLLRHGRAFGRRAVRYAIERFPAARRRRLLSFTRPAAPPPRRSRG